MNRLAQWGAVAFTLTVGPAAVLETDQYRAWGRQSADSTEAVNAKSNLEFEPGLGLGLLYRVDSGEGRK